MSESNLRSSWRDAGFTVGPWRVDPLRNVIVRGDEEKHLENRLMQTLVYLAENQGRAVPRAEFFDSVWRGRVVNEEALSRAISLLRTMLGDNAQAPEFIQTIPGVGYRLIARVVTDQSPGSAFKAVTPDFQPNSIAVLPFLNLSDDASNEYFSDGVSEEILNVLSQIDRFKVVGRTSSFAFKGRNEDLRKVGKTLNVTHVLEGSVRKADARVRITAQLIKTDDGYHLWSQTFDRELDDILKVQDEIAAAVVEALKVKLLGESSEPKVVGGTDNSVAYQAYLKGLHHQNRGARKESILLAIDTFTRAVELDPGFARAWAGLAISLSIGLWNGLIEQQEGRARGMAAAERAVELAPDLASGHLALATHWQQGNPRWAAAQRSINRALDLNPGNPGVLIEYARIHLHLGHFETSIAAARKALELEPVSVYAHHILGHVLYFARRYEEAIPAFRETLEMDPYYPKPHYFIAMSLHWMGQSEAALEEIRKEPLSWMKNTASAAILHRLGRTEEAEDFFQRLRDVGVEQNNFIQQADLYAQMGDTDLAIDALNTALEYGDPGFTQLLVDPFLDPIRDDPRFVKIFEKVGFKTYQGQCVPEGGWKNQLGSG